MKITNTHNLPQALYQSICKDDYSRGDAEVNITSLIKPVQMQFLERNHWKDIQVDAMDQVCLFLGKCLHHGLEEVDEPTAIIEQRFYLKRDLGSEMGGEITLGACVDHFSPFDGILTDYKLCQVHSIRDGAKEEWVQQLNCYAHILREQGFPVKKAQIVAVLKDHSKAQAAVNPEYPQQPIQIIDITLWPETIAESYIVERLKAYRKAMLGMGFEPCSDTERWKSPDSYKIYRGDNKRATKCFASEDEAAFFVESMPEADYRVVKVEGKPNRCAYCNVRHWCKQWLAENEEQ